MEILNVQAFYQNRIWILNMYITYITSLLIYFHNEVNDFHLLND